MSDRLETQREILRLVEAGDAQGLEDLAVREGIDRDLWRYFIAAMKPYLNRGESDQDRSPASELHDE